MMQQKLVPIALIFDPDGDLTIYAIHDPSTCRKTETPPVLPDCPGCQAEQLAEWLRELYRPSLLSFVRDSEGYTSEVN